MIRFRDGKPIGIYFSQHRDGAAYSWDDSTVTKRNGRVRCPFFAMPDGRYIIVLTWFY
jgi:hypothetical protein